MSSNALYRLVLNMIYEIIRIRLFPDYPEFSCQQEDGLFWLRSPGSSSKKCSHFLIQSGTMKTISPDDLLYDGKMKI